jgi:hypothetical protein
MIEPIENIFPIYILLLSIEYIVLLALVTSFIVAGMKKGDRLDQNMLPVSPFPLPRSDRILPVN